VKSKRGKIRLPFASLTTVVDDNGDSGPIQLERKETSRLPSERKTAMISAMEIREGEEKDVPSILALYQKARLFMAEHGNPDQWTSGAPDRASLKKDLDLRRSYVVVDQGEVVGTFALLSHDPNYDRIDGRWLAECPYIAVHRLASIKAGVGTFILTSLCQRYAAVRIDTHKANIPMQNLLKKLGFAHCGTILLLDKGNSPREAYMKVNTL
jgi:ribosomal protein S18 acetylase RimI-like enzyme